METLLFCQGLDAVLVILKKDIILDNYGFYFRNRKDFNKVLMSLPEHNRVLFISLFVEKSLTWFLQDQLFVDMLKCESSMKKVRDFISKHGSLTMLDATYPDYELIWDYLYRTIFCLENASEITVDSYRLLIERLAALCLNYNLHVEEH